MSWKGLFGMILLFLLFFDFAFINFVCVAYLYSMIKANKLRKEIFKGDLKDVDLSSIGIK